ncbi:MAG: EamA family transporter [Methanoregula sp.]|jgi:undecaprenyl phosphate-alpha-L-ara4N flippase subunit ArnE|nr:EamA family transporter [Methanoregula sp.]
MIFSLSLVFIAVLLTGISQVLLKIGAAHQGDQKNPVLAAYLNFPVITAYALLVFVTVITVIALKEVPLKMVYAITSLNFVVVTILSHWILKEQIGKRMIVALGLIVSGILIFNYPL